MMTDRLLLPAMIGIGLVAGLAVLFYTAERNERKMEKLRKDLVTAAKLVTDPKQAQVHACALLGCISDQLAELTAATAQQRLALSEIATKIGTLPPDQARLITEAVELVKADLVARRGAPQQPKRKHRGSRS